MKKNSAKPIKEFREELFQAQLKQLENRENISGLVKIASQYSKLAELQPEKKDSYCKKAIFYLEAAKEFVNLHDKKLLNWYIAGIWYFKLKKPEKAISYLERSLSHNEKNEDAYEFLSQFNEEIKNYQKAMEYSLMAQGFYSQERIERSPITDEEIDRVKKELENL